MQPTMNQQTQTPEQELAQGTRQETDYFFVRLGNELEGCRSEMRHHETAVDAHHDAIASLQARERALLLALRTREGDSSEPDADDRDNNPGPSIPPKMPEAPLQPQPLPRSSIEYAPAIKGANMVPERG